MKVLKNKKFDEISAIAFGFKKCREKYEYNTEIMNGEFLLRIEILPPNEIKTLLTEKETKEPYTLHLSNITGDFVGQIREEYNKIIFEIKEKCFNNDIFKSNYTKKVIEYIKEKYNDEIEYLWEKFPDNAVARRKDNKKWYIAILTVKKNKIGLKGEENIEVADLRADPDNIKELTNHNNIYEGYHMNKKHWITIVLDGSMPLGEIYKFIDKSYELAKKK